MDDENFAEDATEFEGSQLEFGDPVDPAEVAAEAVATETPTETPAAEPVETPAETGKPATTPQPKAAASTQPVQQPSAQSASAASRPQPSPPMHDMIAQNHAELVTQLAKSTFALPKEQADLFEDPRVVEFIAQRDAGVYLKTMAAVSRLLHATLPDVVRNVHGISRKSDEYEQDFFTKHSDLRNPAYQPVLRNLLIAVRNSNPSATPEQLMEKLAPVARAALGIAPGKQPPQGNGAAKPRTVPFVPAAQGAGAAAGTPQQPGKVISREIDPLQDINNMLRNLTDSD